MFTRGESLDESRSKKRYVEVLDPNSAEPGTGYCMYKVRAIAGHGADDIEYTGASTPNLVAKGKSQRN